MHPGDSTQIVTWILVMWFVVRPLGQRWARAIDARGEIRSVDAARLETAFALLGPERVAQGLTATGHDWNDGFLAFATGGQPYGLRPGLKKGWRTNPVPSLPEDLTRAVGRVWNRQEAAFRELAEAWLEQQEGPEPTGVTDASPTHQSQIAAEPPRFRVTARESSGRARRD
jgi:hypothetical protein